MDDEKTIIGETIDSVEAEATTEPVKASKRTTAVLIGIIVVLVAIVILFVVLFAKQLAKDKAANTPKDSKSDTEVISGNPAVTSTDTNNASQTAEPVKYDVKTTLGQYKGIEVDYEQAEVSEQDIDDMIEYTLNDYAEEYEVTDGTVEMGDVANIDYTGYMDDVAFDGGADTGYDLEIGSHSFIDDFEEQLIGHGIGETVDVYVTFPEDYYATDMAGKDAHFVVVINSITRYNVPELTLEFVQETMGYDTIEAYRDSVREELEGMAAEDAEAVTNEAIFNKVIEGATYEGEIDAEIESFTQEYLSYYDSMANAYYGVDGVTLFTEMYGITADEYYQMLNEQAEYSIKYQHVLDEIAVAENIEVTDEEYQERFEYIFYEYYGYGSEDEVRAALSQEQIDEMVIGDLKREKAEQIILDNAVINK